MSASTRLELRNRNPELQIALHHDVLRPLPVSRRSSAGAGHARHEGMTAPAWHQY